MRTGLQRLIAILAMVLLGGAGVAATSAWSPTALGLTAPASAGNVDQDDDDDGDDDNDNDSDDDDNDSDDDGDGRVPAGGIQTGAGGAPNQDDDNDNDNDDNDDSDDDDGDGDGRVPAGGVDTGLGGAASVSADEPATREASTEVGDVAATVLPLAALGFGGVVLHRWMSARQRTSAG